LLRAEMPGPRMSGWVRAASHRAAISASLRTQRACLGRRRAAREEGGGRGGCVLGWVRGEGNGDVPRPSWEREREGGKG